MVDATHSDFKTIHFNQNTGAAPATKPHLVQVFVWGLVDSRYIYIGRSTR